MVLFNFQAGIDHVGKVQKKCCEEESCIPSCFNKYFVDRNSLISLLFSTECLKKTITYFQSFALLTWTE